MGLKHIFCFGQLPTSVMALEVKLHEIGRLFVGTCWYRSSQSP